MRVPAIYNEIDPFAAQWLRNLASSEGTIAHGAVNQRSIRELQPRDVSGPGQRHFFAGIGVWSYPRRRGETGERYVPLPARGRETPRR